MNIKVLKEEVNELIDIQEVKDAYISMSNILKGSKQLREEFNFSDDQKKVTQEEFNDAYYKVSEWWRMVCNKYNIDPENLRNLFLDYNTLTIRNLNG